MIYALEGNLGIAEYFISKNEENYISEKSF